MEYDVTTGHDPVIIRWVILGQMNSVALFNQLFLQAENAVHMCEHNTTARQLYIEYDSVTKGGPGWRSRYSDLIRAGRSGDRIPVGGDIFRTYPDRPWDPPSLLYNGNWLFSGGKAAGAWR
jgi:hypothetical protein